MNACPDFREYGCSLAAVGSETIHTLFWSEAMARRPVRAAGVPTAALFLQPCAVDVVYGEVYRREVARLTLSPGG